MSEKSLIPHERIEQSILLIRGHKVMLDVDLAGLYDVDTRALNQAVKRNIDRFPPDFAFQLKPSEFEALRSQTVTSKGRGGRRYLPYVFTEYGVAMLSSVLKSERAIYVNIEIMRVFGRLRRLLASHADLLRRLDDMEKKYDDRFRVVFDAIRQLMEPPEEPPKERMGFSTETINP
jgi:ORF6N domain